jgi:hypothetical protein
LEDQFVAVAHWKVPGPAVNQFTVAVVAGSGWNIAAIASAHALRRKRGLVVLAKPLIEGSR